VMPEKLPSYLKDRRADPCWRGCNVTAPLKQKASELVGAPTGPCDFIGAVNCVVRTPLSCLVGTNTDLNGVQESLGGLCPSALDVVLIGSGGAARAALCYLVRNSARKITILTRNIANAQKLKTIMGGGEAEIQVAPLNEAPLAITGADLIINATPLGMADADPMPENVTHYLSARQTIFDMVYAPVETELLIRARAVGAKAVDGLTMLIGQAAPAFELFFGVPAPRQHDRELRKLLVQ